MPVWTAWPGFFLAQSFPKPSGNHRMTQVGRMKAIGRKTAKAILLSHHLHPIHVFQPGIPIFQFFHAGFNDFPELKSPGILAKIMVIIIHIRNPDRLLRMRFFYLPHKAFEASTLRSH